MRAAALGGIALSACFLLSSNVAQAGQPLRHLVFNYTFGSSSDIEVHTSGFADNNPDVAKGNSASGVASYENAISDRGTITIDVMKEEQDHSLLLMVSEQSQNNRGTAPTRCVVFGPVLGVVCDPNATIHEEELSLLRLVGTNFVDPARVDAKQHWQVDRSGGGLRDTADFTITKNNGGQMVISETTYQKAIQNGRDETTDGDSTIGYDYIKQVPTSVHAITVSREPQGMDQYRTLRTEITASLETDSGVAVR